MRKVISYSISLLILNASFPAYAGSVVCADFGSQAEAQAYFDAKKSGYKRLDLDKDGIACEALR
ncbi:excalibur calcium-binding domain-containing protein [Psychrobacter cryohalolentis]|uniref:excalibur calcium-binding domain-containing protein n=1 Tax=Psychrobacter sp. D2 TaxID=2759702 RepID=UPI0015E5B567|nr:excalibur calcium-binding domain-containing protein [Psychrobacter sp. D2]MBA2056330.1 excalibur calcium-binding domain-containing protein [Psychrobacter sp. D2]